MKIRTRCTRCLRDTEFEYPFQGPLLCADCKDLPNNPEKTCVCPPVTSIKLRTATLVDCPKHGYKYIWGIAH